MATDVQALNAVRAALARQLARCAQVLDGTDDDAATLTLRDLLLDFQFESRALITAAEARLGAFSGDDDPRAIAANAEALIERVEELQDAWETRVDLLLEAGFDGDLPEFLNAARADHHRLALLDQFFSGLPGDMDQTAVLLEYAKRYLLSLLDGSGRHGRA